MQLRRCSGSWVGVLVFGAASFCLLSLSGALGVLAEAGETVNWVPAVHLTLDDGSQAQWDGVARLGEEDGNVHLICEGLTNLRFPGTWVDVRVSMRVRLGSGGFGIAVREGEGHAVEFGCTQDYYVLTRTGGPPTGRDHDSRLLGDRWYSVVFVALGNRFSVEVDGQTWFEIEAEDAQLIPGRVRIVASPADDPILLDDLRIWYAHDLVGTDEVLPALSGWDVVFEEEFGPDWNESAFSENPGSSGWELICAPEGCHLRLECNCWAAFQNQGVWGDYAVMTRVRIDHGGATVSFRSGRDGRYFVGIERWKLTLGREYPSHHRSTLAISPFPVEFGIWYDLTIVGLGSELMVFLDGQLQIRYVDETDTIWAGGTSYETIGGQPIVLIDRLEIRVASRALSEGILDPEDLLTVGRTYLGEGNAELAHEAFARALDLFAASQDSGGEAEALRWAGTALAAYGRMSDAVAHLARALQYYERTEHLPGKAYCYLRLGEYLLAQGEEAAAEDRLKAARAALVQLEDRVGEMQVLEQLASLYERRHAWEETAAALRAVVEIAAEIDDRGRLARTRLSLAESLMALGLYGEAEATLKEARDAYRRLSDVGGEISALRSLVHCYSASGDWDRAVAAQRVALQLAEDENLHITRGWLLLDLGRLQTRLGPTQVGIESYESALLLFQQEDHLEGIGAAFILLANAYGELRLYSLSFAYTESAYEVAVAGGFLGMQASALRGMSELLEDTDADLATVYRERAQDILSRIQDTGTAIYERHMRSARDHLERGEVDEAIAVALEALAGIARSRWDPQALLFLARCERARSDLPAARAYFEEALDIQRRLGHTTWKTEAYLADISWRMGDLVSAEGYFIGALARAEEALQGLKYEPHIRSYMAYITGTYLSYLEFLVQNGRPREALWIAERFRSRTLLDAVGGGDVGGSTSFPGEGLRARLITADAIDRDVTAAIVDLPPRTAIIEYLLLGGHFYAWVVRDGDVTYHHMSQWPRGELQTLIVRLRELIEGGGSGLQGFPGEDLFALSSQLFEILVAPLLDSLAGVDHLIIVPSGPLYYLPFSALLNCPSCTGRQFLGGNYLFEMFSLSMTPSIAALRHALDLRPSRGVGLLALADPDPGDPLVPRLPEAVEEAVAVRDLLGYGAVYVGSEATEQVVREHAGSASHLLFSSHGVFDPQNPLGSYLQLAPAPGTDGKLYTYEIFELQLSADLVTLSACETLLPSLSVARDVVRAERGLFEGDPVDLGPDRLDQLTSGDEIVGLTRAFIYAGASSVLSTLWSVASGPTRDLMIQFYRYLAEGLTRAEALRMAQTDVRGLYPHPRYWAGFVLVGDWRTIPSSQAAGDGIQKASP